MLRTLIVFLAGFVPFAVFWPLYGAVAGFWIGLSVTIVALVLDRYVWSNRKERYDG